MTPCGLDMSFMRYYERVNVKQCLGLRKIPSACTKLRARQQGLPGKYADSRDEVAQIPSNNTSATHLQVNIIRSSDSFTMENPIESNSDSDFTARLEVNTLNFRHHSMRAFLHPIGDGLQTVINMIYRLSSTKTPDMFANPLLSLPMPTLPDFPVAMQTSGLILHASGLHEEEASAKGRLKYWDLDLVKKKPQTFDFIVTLGGDGTVLYASWLFQQVVPPVLSFALGSLGFLTNFDFERYQSTLETAFRDGVTVSLRLRFECTIMRSRPRPNQVGQRDLVEELIGEESDDDTTHHPDKMFQILNDVVVDRGPNPTMSSIEIFGDDEHFTSVQADGVCVATPTGSTAYNLAAGGSLSHPENPVILLTAICAHTLNFRPIILPDTIVLRVGVPYNARTSSWAGFDGRERMELCPGDYVTISASRYPFACVSPSASRSHDWIQSISRTLNWNSRQRQKAFDASKGCDADKGKI
ncbi:NAD+ kinase [Histoplasma capsulatum H143]|uniref:NAD+ kinase n=1 Tax=Ajellomyces capsulatus (strain H143) TaxID=544712 RepID=C6HKM6_AJECH|nr:NAD+ kinase [Histoplasma capsulatum H143]